jgi:hypothetical protein
MVSKERSKREIVSLLSILMLFSGIAIALGNGTSNPWIEMVPSHIPPGETVNFRIHLYLVYDNDPNNPSWLNAYLDNLTLPDPKQPGTCPAIRVWKPGHTMSDAPDWIWIGPPSQIIIDGGPPGDKGIYIDIPFGPGAPGWSAEPDTTIEGRYMVDFWGRIYTTNEAWAWHGSRNFDVYTGFNVPELEISAALIISSLGLLLLRNRWLKQ